MAKNIYEAIKLVYYLTNITGIFSYSIIKTTHYKILIKRFDYIKHILKILIFSSFTLSIKTIVNKFVVLDKIDATIDQYQVYAIPFGCLINFLACQLKFKTLKCIVEDLDAVDAIFKKMRLSTNYNDINKMMIKMFVLYLLFIVLIVSVFTFTARLNYDGIILHTLFAATSTAMYLKMLFFLFVLKEKFSLLNDRLLYFGNDIEVLKKYYYKEIFEEMQTIVYVHGRLVKVTRSLNHLFGFVLGYMFAIMFCLTVICLYYNITYIMLRIYDFKNIVFTTNNVIMLALFCMAIIKHLNSVVTEVR